MATDNQKKALKIIQDHIAISGLQFAKEMWPDSNMHNHPLGRVVRNGHSYLYKLVKNGWVDVHQYKYPQFYLTPEGTNQIKEK